MAHRQVPLPVTPAPTPKEALGAQLRQARCALDLTQWNVAKLAGISQTSVVKAERGRPVSDDVLRRIADALLKAKPKQ